MPAHAENPAEQHETDSDLTEQHQELFDRVKKASSKLGEKERPSRRSGDLSLSEQLINMLGPIQREGPDSTSEELSALNRLTSAIAESVEQDIISEEEAESLLRHALSNFLEKRMDEVVNGLFSKSHSKWFLAASHRFYEREE